MKRRASSSNRDSMLSLPHPLHRRILSLFHRRVIRVLYQPEESMTCIARFQPDRSFLMPFAQLADQRICFEDTGGDGLPVILSHGFLMTGNSWRQPTPDLRAGPPWQSRPAIPVAVKRCAPASAIEEMVVIDGPPA
jgi:hypothetical protein